jgi:hypothetical protein
MIIYYLEYKNFKIKFLYIYISKSRSSILNFRLKKDVFLDVNTI